MWNLEFSFLNNQVNIYLCAHRYVSWRLNGRTGRRGMNWKVEDVSCFSKLRKKTRHNPDDVIATH